MVYRCAHCINEYFDFIKYANCCKNKKSVQFDINDYKVAMTMSNRPPILIDYCQVEYVAYQLPDKSYDLFMLSNGVETIFVGNLSEDEWLDAMVTNSIIELDWFQESVVYSNKDAAIKTPCICDFTGPNVWSGCQCGGK